MDLLTDEDQQAQIVLMDSLAKRSPMSKLMARLLRLHQRYAQLSREIGEFET